jgi:hypothetical protein
MDQGAEDVDGAAVEAFAADQDLGPVGGLVGAGELPAAGSEVAQIQPPAARVAAGRLRTLDAQTIAAFSARLRDQVDLDTLTGELLAVVDQIMQPTQASLWLRSGACPRQPAYWWPTNTSTGPEGLPVRSIPGARGNQV